MQKNRISLRIIASSSIGTILEWYDFSLFAFLTPLLANYFFPHENKFPDLCLPTLFLPLVFFVRPLGAVFFWASW